MKNTFAYTQSRLASLSWYIWLFVIGFAFLGNQCGCQINAPIDNISTSNTPPTNTSSLSLQFEKLSYDRNSSRLIVIIKNTGKKTAKDLSLRCTNISKDETSRTAVWFNNTPTTTTLPIPNLEAGSSTQEIYVAIDFQTTKEALVQVEVLGGQQIVTTNAIQINRFPLDLVCIGPVISIAKPGEIVKFKWKLVTIPHEQFIDFTKFQLEVMKLLEEDVIVSVENIGKILDQPTNAKIISGVDLEKLAKQQEIIVKVKNNNTTTTLILFYTLSDNEKPIARIVNILAPDIQSALLPAAGIGDVKLVKQAISAGVDVNLRNTRNVPVLHLAILDGHQKIVKILLENGADGKAKDNDGNTALHLAASLQRKEIVETLLTHGADKDIKNNNGETAADLAKDQEIKNLINNWKN